MKKSVKWLYVIAVICFVVSAVMLYKGYDKMTNYKNPESIILDSVNAYVGGDAYNYIINGTYSTSFFTLASGFMVTGFVCIIGGMIVTAINSKEIFVKIEEPEPKEIEEKWNEELPSL